MLGSGQIAMGMRLAKGLDPEGWTGWKDKPHGQVFASRESQTESWSTDRCCWALVGLFFR